MQTKSQNALVLHSANPASSHGLRRIFQNWRDATLRLCALFWRLLDTTYILRASFDSFLAHTRIRFATRPPSVDYGPAFHRLSDGTYQAEARTLARAEYTKAVSATRPWADTVDLEIFLMGFDAGERWALHKWDIATDKAHEKSATWLSLAEENIRRAIKLSNIQISEVTPADIAGVTGGA
jgi:hypothetical protein